MAVSDSDVTGAWNVGTGIETSVNQIAALLGARAVHGPAKAGEQRRSVLDGSRLGVARTPLREGLAETVAWFEEQRGR